MTEPTTDELARIGRRWSSYAGMGEPRSADDYDDAGCRILAEAAFRDAPALLALVAAQAEQIARHDDMRLANYAKAETDKARERAERAEAKIAELEAAAEHWERVMVVVTDQAAEYVATFARVRALCDRLAGDSDPAVDNAAELFRAAIDGTEAPA